MTTITINADTHDTVRFDQFFNPETEEWELVKTSTRHIGSYHDDTAPQHLADFWNAVYFERTPFNYTRVFVNGQFVGDIVYLRNKDKNLWFIDVHIQQAVAMTLDTTGFHSEQACQRAILKAWQEKQAPKGKRPARHDRKVLSSPSLDVSHL